MSWVATGDLCQSNPVENEHLSNNVHTLDARTEEAMDLSFPNQITLKVCKRLSTDEERPILPQMKAEMFG
eukprot:CAMPEP_0184482532 /NCGR_PEP_ID=MMETSP0113_2-20130426/4097_1 /TAXON_ID=91329 /ORGANISM="Norrisiella sphaerica, Strain BC52" /LENGTH=69 /DNA_ID=CAMNT_0026862317 /DNA_START=548 /DNA_END=757 /DNA_ORIENTATION=+